MSKPTAVKQRETNIRQAHLLATIQREGGQWTTKRAIADQVEQGLTPSRYHARTDLHSFEKRGLLISHGLGEQRHYTPNRARLVNL